MLLKADVKSLKSFDIANADVIEYKVHANTRITRKPVAQLNLPPSVNIGRLPARRQSAHGERQHHFRRGRLGSALLSEK